ncbi:MAG: AtpZ/AtpI family protein [bacterium]|jgi:branched-subunit amino acid ABC-type transport system permease component
MAPPRRLQWVFAAGTLTLGLAIAVIGGYYLGNWLDNRFSTGSLFSILLVLVAIVGGFANLYRSFLGRSSR